MTPPPFAPDDLAAARGIVLGLELAGLLWVAALAAWAWMRWHGGAA